MFTRALGTAMKSHVRMVGMVMRPQARLLLKTFDFSTTSLFVSICIHTIMRFYTHGVTGCPLKLVHTLF